MNDGWTGLCLLLAGSCYFPLVYSAIKHVLTKRFKHRLSSGDICLICEKCTNGIQAIMSFVCGGVIVSQVKHIMVDTHWLTNSYACFALPYFVHDLRAMYLSFITDGSKAKVDGIPLVQRLQLFVRSSPLLVAHHTIMPIIIFPAVIMSDNENELFQFYRHNLGDFFVGAFYMIEITIPFIAARAIMVQLNLKNSPYYVMVGLLMMLSFFISRVLIFPYLYWCYAVHAGIDLLDVPASIPIKCNLGCLMILLPQLYWFWLMLRGTVRVFYKIFVHWKSKSHDV